MSSQNNIAKESSSLQNHIVWPCFIFITRNALIMHNPDDKPSNCFILQYSQTFSTFTQYMSASHGHSTIGGTEYDDRGCVEKKRRKSHIDAANQREMEMPINLMSMQGVGIAMQRMHQSYKYMKARQKKLSGCASNLLAHEDLGHFEEAHYRNIQAKFYNENSHQYMKVTK